MPNKLIRCLFNPVLCMSVALAVSSPSQAFDLTSRSHDAIITTNEGGTPDCRQTFRFSCPDNPALCVKWVGTPQPPETPPANGLPPIIENVTGMPGGSVSVNPFQPQPNPLAGVTCPEPSDLGDSQKRAICDGTDRAHTTFGSGHDDCPM